MPLTNGVIAKLNEITVLVQDKSSVDDAEIGQIRAIFEGILKDGGVYNVEEIESWFENEGSWKDKNTITRMTNLSHYTQSRYEQGSKLRMAD